MQAGNVSAARLRGFSLIELLVAIVVLGIVAVSFGVFILPAINAHQDMQRRAALVDAAESAFRQMSRDIRIALPNSVRITNTATGFAIEMIPTVDGARYCRAATPACITVGADNLTIGANDTSFDVLGCFRDTAFLAASGTNAYRLVVGSSDAAVYTVTGSPAVITPVMNISLSACSPRHSVTLGAAHTFPPPGSPRQRVFVVQDVAAPVTYVCNATAGTITRHAGYRVGSAYSTATQPTDPGAAPLSTVTGRQVTGNVSACSTTSDTSTVQAKSIITLSLSLSTAGETVQLMKQVQLDNSQ